MQVRVHELGHDVDVVEVGQGGRRQDVHDLDDVHVVQAPKEPHLPHDALSVHHVVER